MLQPYLRSLGETPDRYLRGGEDGYYHTCAEVLGYDVLAKQQKYSAKIISETTLVFEQFPSEGLEISPFSFGKQLEFSTYAENDFRVVGQQNS